MYDLVAVDDLDPSQYLVENVECLLEGEDLVGKLALHGVKITHVAVLHHQEVPVSLYIIRLVPSKVLNNLTMFGCYNAAIVFIYWMRLFLSCGSLIIFFLERHLIA